LGEIDRDMDRGVVNDDNVLRRFNLKRDLLQVSKVEDKDRIQKSKIKWAVEGDENSKFFHGIINKRRSQHAIRGVFVDGIWQTDPDTAVWDCGDNKSPGLDGFSFEFFKKYWDLIGPDFCGAVRYFLRRAPLLKAVILRSLL
nr:RNA-directed DNA polymerase, eukaryota [Tanacetum cinerariifolium]